MELAACQVIVTGRRPLREEVLGRSIPHLRHVQLLGRHFDHVDWRAARTLGLTIGTQPRMGSWTVAELALTFILALSKEILRAHDAVRTGAYRAMGLEPTPTSQRRDAFQWMRLPVREVAGATVGVVGMGEIGAELALRLRPLGVTTRYFKRHRLSPRPRWCAACPSSAADG
ncbi:MAG TPA: NAD(P)-dependent oxidoreductase [bacterium]|nr:NAD(P)-dependent oxidoreductase [bacterium]